MIDEPMTCPFCGGGPELFTKRNSDDEWIAYLSCGKCDVEMMATGSTELDADAAVIEKWNARAERTCRIDGVRGGGNCGTTTYRLSCGHVAVMPEGTRFGYCPGCGAKVVG